MTYQMSDLSNLILLLTDDSVKEKKRRKKEDISLDGKLEPENSILSYKL